MDKSSTAAIRQLYSAGKFSEAAQAQVAHINSLPVEQKVDRASALVFMGAILFALGDFKGLMSATGAAVQLDPGNASHWENHGVALGRCHLSAEARDAFLKALELGQKTPNVYDGLANCYGRLRDLDNARKYGNAALMAKDAASAHNRIDDLQKKPVPAFNHNPRRQKNIIAYSIWGDNPRYTRTGLDNIEAAKYLFPAWTCRFYVDESVPADIRKALADAGGQVKMMSRNQQYEGLFWRFLVASDPEVEFFLCRDADSLLSTKERVAVDEWLASGLPFHVMRDFYTHTDLMLAGMWGGVAGILPDIEKLIASYKPPHLTTRNVDQWFLRDMVWPRIRDKTCIHDSLYDVPGTRRFPAVGGLPPDRHVGQNHSVHVKE
ncbi:MAG: hypothetical protein RL095_4164 [Verrucomicrobiota bacterium]|jgi:hypothetical protein